MKLRNKKTGKIGELSGVNRTVVYEALDAPSCGNSILGEYDTLAELNEEWEDYKEPLIKDEKIRKAVRVWAEASGIDTTEIKVSKGIISTAIIGWKDCRRLSMDFESSTLEKLEDGKTYTIAELCGDEGE